MSLKLFLTDTETGRPQSYGLSMMVICGMMEPKENKRAFDHAGNST